ncbi:PQQ-binding-like beta-propeller repeat protein [uncultured Clostridium sp.]|uniref:outer membrane protein assembly factor BamB family protein n=1 Tax=uncultured Clostridium sp. TaxID=59620 RepID=UPI002628F464|nr:PQQ-binding-like beta-propeller repeat protein [uncultured Clostridium sp.]
MKKKAILCLICIMTLFTGCGVSSNEEVLDGKEEVAKVELEENIENIKVLDIKTQDLEYLKPEELTYRHVNVIEDDILFTEKYSEELEGVLTFRGNNFRDAPSYGISKIEKEKISEKWNFTTSSSSWGGGAGWTGQSALVKWPNDVKQGMNMTQEFKDKEGGVEVIQASLDGKIYFLDASTGEETRESINVGNPIKGSLSIDPRGIPLLYVGEGINESSAIGFNIYSLIDGEKLYEVSNDPDAPRGWGAFDSSAIVSGDTDSVIVPGENGIIYKIKLNTKYDKEKNTIDIEPSVGKYIYDARGYAGVESSMATYANLGFFADNKGYINCIDLNNMKPVWQVNGMDDTDATLVIDVEGDKPYIYSGSEVDKQGSVGFSYIKKIDAITGKVIWEKEFECESLLGASPVNGGMLSTPVVGKNDIDDLVIFSLSRYDGFNSGLLVALDKATGEIKWENKLDNYAWSSPVDFYNKDGKGYILQGDSIGNMFLIEGKTGQVLDQITLNANIEASPAMFNDTVVVATRGGSIYGLEIE